MSKVLEKRVTKKSKASRPAQVPVDPPVSKPVDSLKSLEALTPFDPPEPNVDNEYWTEYYATFEQLLPLVLEGLPFKHPVRRIFAECDPAQRIGDKELPNRTVLKAALDAFHAMPDDTRRRVLNGWIVPPSALRARTAKIVEFTKRQPAKVYAHIGAGPREFSDDVIAGLTQLPSEGSTPVEVFVAAGTRKMDAVEILHSLARRLEIHWETMLDQIGRDAQRDFSKTRPDAA